MKKYSVGSNEELQKNSIVTVEEARKATNDYFCGDELATQVWINKYALKDSAGNLYERSPEDMHRRMAREIARIEAKYPNPRLRTNCSNSSTGSNTLYRREDR